MKNILRALTLTTILVTTTMSATAFAKHKKWRPAGNTDSYFYQSSTLGLGFFLGPTGRLVGNKIVL